MPSAGARPRVKLANGRVAPAPLDWAGKLSGFALLFEALVVALGREMLFAAVARLTGLSWHKVHAICERYVEPALEKADFSAVESPTIDETSRAKGHNHVTLFADARRVLFVADGRAAATVGRFADDLARHGGAPERVGSVSIDMSPAFIAGAAKDPPDAQITFEKLHVVAHASNAADATRCLEQRADPALKELRRTLLKSPDKLGAAQRADLNALVAQLAGQRTARAWLCREQLREILNRKQINVVRRMLHQCCGNVNRSKVEPMKAVAKMIRGHLDVIAAWARTRQTNGFIEALNGIFQAAKRKARGHRRCSTLRTVIFPIARKLNLAGINPHAA